MNNEPGSTQLVTPDQITIDANPLSLPMSEQIIMQTLDYAEQRGRMVRQQLGVDDRSKRNVEFYRGEQVDKSKLDARFQEMHVDNVVRQDLENKIKLATGKMPDLFVAPPDDQDANADAAHTWQSYLRDRMTSSVMKRLIKNGLRKMDLEFIGIIKCRYDGKYQQSKYELIDSKNVLFGEGARVFEDGFTIDGTNVLFHYVEEDTQQVLNRFPNKATDLLRVLSADGKQIPSRITYTEASFSWYDRKGDCHEGIACRFQTVLLAAFKQPYFNYENQQLNYFDRPRKNYILFSYTNLGESVYETTTDFEQGVPINRIINRRRRQITEISDRAVPKLAFLGGSMTKELAENISPNPNEGIILSDAYQGDDINKAMAVIPATPPNPILYNDMADLRSRIHGIFATHGATTGENAASGESGVSKQISREGDLVTSDDIVDITIERVMYEIACWESQFLRLYHDDDRPPYRVTNSEGETENIQLNRKTIETDIQVVVKASSNDKATRRADAIQLLNAQAIDPYTLLEDLGVSNPRERIRRMAAFIKAQQTGDLASYMEVIGVDPKTPFATESDAKRDLDILRAGNAVQLKLPSEAYVAAFNSLIRSPEYTDPQLSQQHGWNDFTRSMVEQHIQRMKQLVDQEVQKAQQSEGINSDALMGGAMGQQGQGAPGAPQGQQQQPFGMPTSMQTFTPQRPMLTAGAPA